LTTCSGDADCVTGHVCSSGSCVPAPPDAGSGGGVGVDAGADAGDASAAGSGGTGTGATGGTGASGGSGGSGASAAAAGSVADAGDAGPKRPGAAVEDDSGCGCRVAAPDRDGTRGLALIAGIALLAAARRRRVTHSR
jgi:MYXO-CTERM domain-containing protein